MDFKGFAPDTFDFLMKIAFNNNKAFFEENKNQYETFVKKPLIALEENLQEKILQIDSRLRTGKYAISRIYRDTRFSKDKLPFRDHAWIGYKPQEALNSQFFGIYFEITPISYGYGMGCYGISPKFIKEFREKVIKNKNTFLKLIQDEKLNNLFTLNGEDYKKPPSYDCDKQILPYLHKRRFYLEHNSSIIANCHSPALLDEIIEGFEILSPLYKFIHNLP